MQSHRRLFIHEEKNPLATVTEMRKKKRNIWLYRTFWITALSATNKLAMICSMFDKNNKQLFVQMRELAFFLLWDIFFLTLWKRTDLPTEQLNQNSRCFNTQKIIPAKCLLAMLSDTRKRLLRWIFIVQNYFYIAQYYRHLQRHTNRTHICLTKRFGIALVLHQYSKGVSVNATSVCMWYIDSILCVALTKT